MKSAVCPFAGSLLLLVATVVQATGLPDTGQAVCYDDGAIDVVPVTSAYSIARDMGSHPRQDCRYGRDAAATAGVLPKIGAGEQGFDYTKIANNGGAVDANTALGTGASDWACTRDNVTGLTWEVKTIASNTDLRYAPHTYSWYSTDGATNGGTDGATNGGNEGGAGSNEMCNSTLQYCNTQAFVAAVNADWLCAHNDWRLPSQRELLTLVHMGASTEGAVIDPTYFPNAPPPGAPVSAIYWSGTTSASDATKAWAVQFDYGTSSIVSKSEFDTHVVRLVRGTPF